jgi:pimeloyl-ACP methyl ester carboxylesterase
VSETFVRDFQASTLHVPVPEPFFEQVLAESRKLPAHVWRGVAEGLLAVDDSAELGRIRAPTLLLWGEQDGYFLRDEQERLVAAIPGARLVVYQDTGHDLHWERPEQVARDLDAFLGDA